MKKIGLFLESDQVCGGIFQYNQTMLEAVAALPPEQYSVVVGYTSELWLEFLQAYELKAVFVPSGFWGRALGMAWTLLGLPMGIWRKFCPLFHPMAKVLMREQCDLWIFPSQNKRSFHLPVPALVTIHDLMHRYERRFAESASWWEYLNRERTYVNICRWAKGVLVDSAVGKQHVLESYEIAAERIHILPYIAPGYIRQVDSSPDFASRYRLPTKFIFYPAQFWEHKNHKRLLEAVAQLKPEIPELKLVLVGSPRNAYAAIVKQVQELNLTDDVVFLGYIPDADMPELYCRARALVMPTMCGPTNIPPLEAFAVGCPVAISGIYGMPEQAGGAALLFNPYKVAEIADCIRRLWTDDRLCAELSGKGKRWSANWGLAQFSERLGEIIDLIVDGDGKLN